MVYDSPRKFGLQDKNRGPCKERFSSSGLFAPRPMTGTLNPPDEEGHDDILP